MDGCSTTNKRGFHRLEHQVLKLVSEHKLEGRHLMLAVSGGLDSMGLVTIFSSIAKAKKLSLTVCYIHHGIVSGRQGSYRRQAWQFIHDHCARRKLKFASNLRSMFKLSGRWKYDFSVQPKAPLQSEAEFREFRYQCLQELMVEHKCDLLLTAHTSNDQLETRIIRLIRGTGADGFEGIRVMSGNTFRPLLPVSRKELKSYLKRKRVKWLEDPSNKSVEPLRNWVRQKWLPQLEAHREGSVQSVARSLQLVAEALPGEDLSDLPLSDSGVSLVKLLSLGRSRQGQVLARYMNRLGIKNYQASHINEVLKRLDKGGRERKFTLLKHDWTIGAQHISASPRS